MSRNRKRRRGTPIGMGATLDALAEAGVPVEDAETVLEFQRYLAMTPAEQNKYVREGRDSAPKMGETMQPVLYRTPRFHSPHRGDEL
jgi:hypothetical protein